MSFWLFIALIVLVTYSAILLGSVGAILIVHLYSKMYDFVEDLVVAALEEDDEYDELYKSKPGNTSPVGENPFTRI